MTRDLLTDPVMIRKRRRLNRLRELLLDVASEYQMLGRDEEAQEAIEQIDRLEEIWGEG